jgi:hypothetical protein
MRDLITDADIAVDAVAREAATDLRRRSAARPFAPRRSQRADKASRGRVAFAVVTLVLLVAGLFIVVRRGENAPASPAPPDSRWVIDSLPTGWSTVSVQGPDEAASVLNFDRRSMIFASPSAPLGPILQVSWNADPTHRAIVPGEDLSATGFMETSLDGRRGAFADGPTGQRYLYVEIDAEWVVLQSRGLSDEQMTAIGSTIAIDDERNLVLTLDTLPAGVFQLPDGVPGDASLTSRSTQSFYATSADEESQYYILAVAPTPSAWAAYYALRGAEREQIDVDGVIGHYLTGVGGALQPNLSAIVWERDGLVFVVTGHEVDLDQLVTAARSVRPATSREWQSLTSPQSSPEGTTVETAAELPPDTNAPLPISSDPPIDVDDETVVTELSSGDVRYSGSNNDGHPWMVTFTVAVDTVRVAYAVDGTGQGTSYGELLDDPARLPIAHTGVAGFEFVTVASTDGAADVLRVTTRDGRRITQPVRSPTGHPDLFIAAVAAESGSLLTAELLDADGNVLSVVDTN